MKNFKCLMCDHESERFYLGTTDQFDDDFLADLFFEVEIQSNGKLKLIGPAPGYSETFDKLNTKYWSDYIQNYLDKEFDWDFGYLVWCPECGAEYWAESDDQDDPNEEF